MIAYDLCTTVDNLGVRPKSAPHAEVYNVYNLNLETNRNSLVYRAQGNRSSRSYGSYGSYTAALFFGTSHQFSRSRHDDNAGQPPTVNGYQSHWSTEQAATFVNDSQAFGYLRNFLRCDIPAVSIKPLEITRAGHVGARPEHDGAASVGALARGAA